MNTFKELPISNSIHKQLGALGFEIPTQIQAEAIPHALNGKDIFATAQTGTGKTLAFLIPVLERLLQQKESCVSALVLLPTRELAMQVAQQYEQLAGRHLPRFALLVGGSPETAQIRQLKAGPRLVVATPGRFEDFLKRKLVKIDKVNILVLDEADRMLDMGFVPAIRRIAKAVPRQRQTLLFSATADPSVMHVVQEILRDPVRLALGSTLKVATGIRLKAFEVDASQKASLLRQVLTAESGQSLVFVATKRSTERVAERLSRSGLKVAVIHGDRSQSQRNSALAAFQGGRAQVLVATDVAARGIHVDDIAQVVNYDLPNIPEDFVHRVGRTGRAGATGVATTFYTPLERGDLTKLERALQVRMERVKTEGSLERDERPRPVDITKLRPATGMKSAKRFYLEGEVLQRYAAN